MIRRPVLVLACAALLAVAAGCEPIQTRALNPVGAGGLEPTRPDRDAGLVGIARGFDLRIYQEIAVARCLVVEPVGWDEEDRRLASTAATFLQSELVRELRATGLFDRVVKLGEMTPPGTRALRLDGAITRLELEYLAPARFWNWIGPGAAQVELRLVDVESGRVMLVTADRRSARDVRSQTRNLAGYKALLEESFALMARDLVKFLVRLAAGDSPRE